MTANPSIVSYLVARPSRDSVTAARQQITSDWWTLRRAGFEVYISELVFEEAAAGNPEAAERRKHVLRAWYRFPLNLEFEARCQC